MAPSLLHFKTAAAVAVASAKAAENDNVSRVKLPDKTRNSRVLVLGGTGRVGGSAATALSKLCPDLRIVVGGRNRFECQNPVFLIVWLTRKWKEIEGKKRNAGFLFPLSFLLSFGIAGWQNSGILVQASSLKEEFF